MDLGRLRTLQELAIRGTMASVAEALRMSPSAVSQQVAQLEIEAGLPLIERRGRGVRLTVAGTQLTTHAARIIAILEQARTDLAELRNVVGGELRVAAFPSIAATLFPQVMRAVQDRYPRLQLALTELEPIDGLAALRAWQVDAALIDDLTVASDLAGSNIEAAPIFKDRLYAVLPLKHRLARRPHVALEDLRDDLWAMDSSRNAYTQTVTAACERAGFTPNVNGRCGSFEVVAGLVEAGCSVAVMPGLRLGGFRGRLIAKPLRPEIKRNISVVFRRGERRNPALKAFLSEIETQAERLRPPA